MSTLSQAILPPGTHANRSTDNSAGTEGRIYIETDLQKLCRDNGSTWDEYPMGGMENPMSAAGDIIYGGTGGAPTRLPKGTAAQVLAMNSGATAPEWVEPAVGGDANHAYYANLCALLEPDALEAFNFGTFTYTVAADATKYVLASFNTKLGSAAVRFDIRDPRKPFALRGNTLTGLSSSPAYAAASAITLDPTIPTYTNARTKYFDRLKLIDELPTRVATLSGAVVVPFLPGPYGAIITRSTFSDYFWIVGRYNGGIGFNLANEISDAATVRFDNALLLPVNKNVICEIESGSSGSGAVAFVLLPSTYSVIVDANSYDFRDDFMGSALDTGVWTRVQSSVGNVEIDTTFQWCKVFGSASWGANGLRTNTYSFVRSAGKTMIVDVYTGSGGGGMVGLSTGAGNNYTDFAHALNINGTTLEVYENGTSRGSVGTITFRTIYRYRFTPNTGDQGCAYAIQGGAFGALGSASWTTLTPGTSSSATDTFHPGATVYDGNTYLGDVRVY